MDTLDSQAARQVSSKLEYELRSSVRYERQRQSVQLLELFDVKAGAVLPVDNSSTEQDMTHLGQMVDYDRNGFAAATFKQLCYIVHQEVLPWPVENK